MGAMSIQNQENGPNRRNPLQKQLLKPCSEQLSINKGATTDSEQCISMGIQSQTRVQPLTFEYQERREHVTCSIATNETHNPTQNL